MRTRRALPPIRSGMRAQVLVPGWFATVARGVVASIAISTATMAGAQWPSALLGPRPPGLSEADRRLVVSYQPRIVEVAGSLATQAPLTSLMRPVMQSAAVRSKTADPLIENRGALLALALYVNGNEAPLLLPEAAAWPRPGPRRFSMRGRVDLARHFIVSAAIVAAAGVPVADALGLYKEMADARDGSGFSFADLAADRAGQAFGKAATSATDTARGIHAKTTAHWSDADIMPVITDLPENLSEAEFARRYQGAQAPAYEALVREIDQRIAALAIYR